MSLTDGLVLHLPIDEKQGTKCYDHSGYRNDGTITGAIWGRTATGLWTLSFDGDDWADCGSGASLVMGTQDWAVEAWVKGTVPYERIILGTANYGDS